MRNIKLNFILFVVFCVFLLSACFSPWMGDEGFVTFNFGNSARSLFVIWEEESNLTYEVGFGGANLHFTATLKNGSGTIAVPIGTYWVSVRVYDRNGLRGMGFAEGETEVRAGKNTNVEIDMYSAVEVNSWEGLREALEDSSSNRRLYIHVKNNLQALSNGITVNGEKFLISNSNITIDGSSFTNPNPMFTLPASNSNFIIVPQWHGGTITIIGNQNANNPIIRINDGYLEISGVTLRDNKRTTGNGGAVEMNGGYFNMDDGTITGNSAAYGGGVYINGQFSMSGGTITGNSATTEGGGVRLTSGNFYMEGGTISGNNSGNQGGGVYVATGGLNIVNGIIYGTNENNASLLNTPNALFRLANGTATFGDNIPILLNEGSAFGPRDATIHVINGQLQ
ncbi:MAG: hypothetical protein FWD47_08035 [Treponema sp.]|nr:hypothetical protein [Treponema sp.]